MESLLSTPIEHLVPPDQKLVILHAHSPVPSAFKTLASNNIYGAPVFDQSQNAFIGFVDMLDIVTFIVKIFDEQEAKKKGVDANEIFKIFEEYNDRLEQIQKFDMQHVEKVVDLSSRNAMVGVECGTTLRDALEKLAKEKLQRLAITKNGLMWNILSLSRIIDFLANHAATLEPALTSKAVKDMDVLKEVHTVSSNQSALDAFRLMATKKVNAVGVTDSDGTLLSAISSKDIKLVATEALFSKLRKTALEFVSLVRARQIQATAPVFACKPTNTFQDVLQKLATLRVHRLFVVDESKHASGVVSLSDLATFLVKQ